MAVKPFTHFRRAALGSALLLIWLGGGLVVEGIQTGDVVLPTGGVVPPSQATISSSGSQMNINQTSASAFINWQTFNIGAGETVNFNQPSSSAFAWNYIGDANPSSINGALNANGIVVLQNPNGITVGGTATINAHGLIMTTASTPALNFSSGGPWSFDAPPPAATIVNCGQINISGGGSAYLIASDIENHGTISAPGGNIGLYAGETVLVSSSPDGRGLSAQVTLPQGSVDNEGRLIADAGSIAAQAQTVNQNGLVQANSVKDVNGTIELVASDAVNLGAKSTISVQGDTQGVSPGGSVTVQSDNAFSDQTGSSINVSGGAQGGNGGQVEISAPTINGINSSISGGAADGFSGGTLNLDPTSVYIDDLQVQAPSGYTLDDVQNFYGGMSLNITASANIEFAPSFDWTLLGEASPVNLTLSAGDSIIFLNGSGINAGQNWSLNLSAGTAVTSAKQVLAGHDGIYLEGPGAIKTVNGDIALNAANDVIIGTDNAGKITAGGGSIVTTGGGNINVTAQYGSINTGGGSSGFDFLAALAPPYYEPDPNLSGISTAGGGNVNLTAGGNVVSFLASNPNNEDAGSGAFGPEPGDVTINAGGNVYGCFVVVNGVGVINAAGNIGDPNLGNVALSLVNGSWTLNAGWNSASGTVQNGLGNIYLQEVRNPNGVFNNASDDVYDPQTGSFVPSTGINLFDYGLQDFVTLNAGNSVNITGSSLPRLTDEGVPLIMPPTLTINAGAGGVTLGTPTAHDQNNTTVGLSDSDITLFPSPYGNLQITTTGGGSLIGTGSSPYLLMSDSGQTQWTPATTITTFGPNDHAALPPELNNPAPVTLNISGSINNVTLQVSKYAQVTVAGNMENASFYGENLQPWQTTTLNVAGQIYNTSSFVALTLSDLFPDVVALSEALLPPGETLVPPEFQSSAFQDNWYAMLALAVNESLTEQLSYNSIPLKQLVSTVQSFPLFAGLNFGNNYIFYNSSTGTLTLYGPAASQSWDTIGDSLYNILSSGTLYLPIYNSAGIPVEGPNNTFALQKVTWLPPNNVNSVDPDLSELQTLITESQNSSSAGTSLGRLVVGGPGQFDVTAGSINLGNSDGILTVGDGGTPSAQFLDLNYSFLAPYMTSGASLTVNVTGADPSPTESALEMPASTIAALGGGSVTVNALLGSMDLGSEGLLQFDAFLMSQSPYLGMGIYTTGGGDVNVTAYGTINVDTSRIATFNGGNVTVTSLTGDVNAGSGGDTPIPINVFLPSLPAPFEYAYVNGIAADTLQQEQGPDGLPDGGLVPGAAVAPGNITVNTPEGDINADVGGILQESLSGDLPPGVSITLNAGTPNSPGDWSSALPPLYIGNINLGNSGAIGGTVNVNATGKVTGLLIASQNANVTGQTVGNLTVLAVGTANVNVGSGGPDVTVIGGQGVNANGLGSDAVLLGQNVSANGGASQSTMGTSASSTAASQAAAQQATQSAAQQVSSNDTGDDEDKKKKKKATVRVGRVTVILSAAVPHQ